MKSHNFRTFLAIGAIGALAAACSDAPTQLRPQQPIPKPAFSVNLTSAGGPTTVNQALWWSVYVFPSGSVGTGNLKPFIRVQDDPNEVGFNADVVQSGEDADGSWTKALPLNRVPEFIEPGQSGTWREFFLDANESNAGVNPQFSIDSLTVWICHDPNNIPAPRTYSRAQFTAAQGGLCQLAWGIGAGAPILAADAGTSGSGSDRVDYRFLINHLAFSQVADAACPYTGAASASDCGYYVILDAHMGYTGGDWTTGATFEEFSTLDRPVPGTLQIVKKVVNNNGGTATVNDFNITSSAGALSFGAGVVSGDTTTYSAQPIPVIAGNYTMIEANVASYTEGTWSCTGATASSTSFDAGLVPVADGQTIVCTIINNDVPPSLTLNKITSYSNGGTRPESDWTLTANGGTAGTLSGPGAAGSTDVVSGASFKAGTYALSESGSYTGYTNGTTYSCVKNGGAPVSSNSITLAVGDVAVCSITNTDAAPSLTLNKITNYTHGGTRAESDWTLTANGGTAGTLSGPGAAGSTDVVSGASFKAGTYTLSESGTYTGYTNGTTFSCVKNGGAPVSSNSITLAVGDVAVCSITNTDVAPSLTLNKITSYSNGGSRPESDWTLTANGGTAGTLSGPGAAGSTDVVSGASFKAGTYALSESGSYTGYTNGTTYSCVKNGAAPVSSNSITLAVGDVAVCSITNTDAAPSLTLNKITSYTHGGTRPESDWTLTANGGTAGTLSGPGAAGSTDVVSGAGFKAGTYTLSESGTYTGYTNGTTFSCVKNGGAPVSSNSITLDVGDVAVCSITNTDVAPSLTLNKITSNSYGGSRPESDWTLTANGGTAGTLSGPGAAGSTDVVSGASFKAGTYALSESGTFTGYTNGTTYSCVKNGGAPVSSNSITLAVGDVAVCSITNHDQPASIRIVKSVKGASSTFNFDASGTGLADFSLTPPADGADSTTVGSLSAGAYSVMELIPSGYTLTGLECSTGGTTDYPAGSTASITLPVGGFVRCAFENTQNANVTRTQGFWATHLTLTQAVWNGGSVGGNTWSGLTDAQKTLCVAPLSIAQVMGGFWSGISKTTTNAKRSDLDQARMQLLQQLLAAILNNAAFGSSPSGPISIAAATSAFCGTDIAAIKDAMAAMASFNTSGDSGLFTPGVSANAKDARALADLVFWNILPK